MLIQQASLLHNCWWRKKVCGPKYQVVLSQLSYGVHFFLSFFFIFHFYQSTYKSASFAPSLFLHTFDSEITIFIFSPKEKSNLVFFFLHLKKTILHVFSNLVLLLTTTCYVVLFENCRGITRFKSHEEEFHFKLCMWFLQRRDIYHQREVTFFSILFKVGLRDVDNRTFSKGKKKRLFPPHIFVICGLSSSCKP